VYQDTIGTNNLAVVLLIFLLFFEELLADVLHFFTRDVQIFLRRWIGTYISMRKYLVGGRSYNQSGQRMLLQLIHQFGTAVFELNPRFLRLDEDGLKIFITIGEILEDSDVFRVFCDDIK
jgi:hypothetical protein